MLTTVGLVWAQRVDLVADEVAGQAVAAARVHAEDDGIHVVVQAGSLQLAHHRLVRPW